MPKPATISAATIHIRTLDTQTIGSTGKLSFKNYTHFVNKIRLTLHSQVHHCGPRIAYTYLNTVLFTLMAAISLLISLSFFSTFTSFCLVP